MKKTTLAMSALALALSLALSPVSVMAAETASSVSTSQQMPSLAPMLEQVMPSVVSINVEGSTTVNTPRMPRNFQQFFGDDSVRAVVLRAGKVAPGVMALSNRNLWLWVPVSSLTQLKAMS